MLGMLADDHDTAFAEALAWDDRRPMPFERARTQLAYGRRLHRERRRADAGFSCARRSTDSTGSALRRGQPRHATSCARRAGGCAPPRPEIPRR